MRRTVTLLLVLAGRAAGAGVPLRDGDTVVFLGDSITEQHLWTAMVETFVTTRLPDARIAFHNRGWGGDTAWDGTSRFERDVAPLKPAVVVVAFGMNDGAYTAWAPWIAENYVEPHRLLARQIAALRAREVLLTPSPVDVHPGAGWEPRYNDTLERLAWTVTRLGAELGAPVVDVFHPLRGPFTRARRARPPLDLVPDSIHPSSAGHLLLAREVLRALDLPRGVGTVRIAGGALAAAAGVTVSAFESGAAGASFALTPPCLPFHVPERARMAPGLAAFEAELNAFTLTVTGWPRGRPCRLVVDGAWCATLTAEAVARGVDLALVDQAPWAESGRLLWEDAQLRYRLAFEAWRTLDTDSEDPELAARPAARALRAADVACAAALADRMHELARPRTYRVELR